MSIANELITRGWTQRTSLKGDGTVCLIGAAAAAYGNLTDDYPVCWRSLPESVRSALLAVIPLDIREDCACMDDDDIVSMGFNDTDGRTFDEVLRVAKEADELLERLADD